MQRILWDHSNVEKVQKCGRYAVNPDGGVAVKHTVAPDGSRSVGFSGLSTCGSVHACPTCNAKIAARRADELRRAVDVWCQSAPGRRVALLTLTVRHNRGQSLQTVWNGIAKAWARVTSGKAWESDQLHHGIVVDGKHRIGWVRGVEALHGSNGWHVHAHVLLFLDGSVDLDRLGDTIFARWQAGARSAGLDAGREAHASGQFLKWIESTDSAAYLVKATWEVTGGAQKQSRSNNRAPFDYLRTFVTTGDLDDLDVWHEWERGSFGRRQLTWARWLKPWLDVNEISDEEIAAEDLDGEPLAMIGPDDWSALVRRKHLLHRAALTLPVPWLLAHRPVQWLERLASTGVDADPPRQL